MTMTRTAPSLRTLLALGCLLLHGVSCTKHNFATKTKEQIIGPVGAPFGFNPFGHYKLSVVDFNLMDRNTGTPPVGVEAGFFLQKFENKAAFNQYMEYLKTNGTCSFAHWQDEGDAAQEGFGDDGFLVYDDFNFNFDDNDDGHSNHGPLESAKNGIMLSMKYSDTWARNSVEYTFKEGDEGLYFLIYQICPFKEGEIWSKFELDFHFDNKDRNGNENYLSAGEMHLPAMYLFFSISYAVSFGLWYTNIRQIQNGSRGIFDDVGGKPVVYAIHQLMSLLLLVKLLSLFFEALRYFSIKKTGHAEMWSFLYYAITIVRGTFLFSMILLIGTGWSFAKPFLTDRELKVTRAILGLQIINNIAIVVLSQEVEGETSYQAWTALLHVVDILCCCAVLFPVVWQVNALEKSLGLDDVGMDLSEREAALENSNQGQTLAKLRKFRHFYLLVVGYIYATRILVYLVSTILDYRHLWVRPFSVELVTLCFYVCVGFMFRPTTEPPQKEDAGEEQVELLVTESSNKII